MGTIPRGIGARLQRFCGGATGRRLAHWAMVLPKIDAFEEELKQLGDGELRKRSLGLRYRAKSNEPLHRLLPEAFALVREAGQRKLGMRHYDVQMLGGIAMHHRCIVEMQTGEGKTLTATLPLYLHALAGKGAHLATANDYLASRDAKDMKPLYEALGMSVGYVESSTKQPDRRTAYASDITYSTAKEIGFDFLRDRLLLRRIREGQQDFLGGMLGMGDTGSNEQPVQREFQFALVDEADSLMIDEARTPLIISALPGDEVKIAVACYRWAAEVAPQFVEDEHYEYDEERRSVELNQAGRQLVRVLPKQEIMNTVGMISIYEYIERAVKVSRDFKLDREYVVHEEEIAIVDEFTGRIAEGRKWRDGIHQALEAKEGLEVSVNTGQAAQITVQTMFDRYEHLAGMTGTAASSANEFRKMYKSRVIPVPTNRPPRRERLPDLVFGKADDKWKAIVDEVIEVHATGRPILIGTRSIDKSEILAKLLDKSGIKYEILNARHIEKEAGIVAAAGDQGKVTVSTNMAGRGTDIKLGAGVAELGGMHVICTELHESARIDRQLIGRCGRQGDPGTFRQYLAMDDDILLSGFGFDKADKLKNVGKRAKSPRQLESYRGTFRKAQKTIERKHFRDRKILMYHAKERRKMQQQMGQDPFLDTLG